LLVMLISEIFIIADYLNPGLDWDKKSALDTSSRPAHYAHTNTHTSIRALICM